MRGLPARIGKLGVMGLVVLGSAGIAFWITGFPATPAPPPADSVADAFATRFPADSTKGDAQPVVPAWMTAGGGADGQQHLALLAFAPQSTSPANTPASFAPDTRMRATAEPGSTGSIGTPSPASRAANRKPTVFNDAQIASIKSRLNLRKDQEEYWPAVEAELRRLAWKKSPDDGRQKGRRQLVALDVSAIDVVKLQSTTAPLLMSFNDEQKRELRMLAHLAGMQDLFSKL
jgi:hypothetical protein